MATEWRVGRRVRDTCTGRLGVIVLTDSNAGADLRVFVRWDQPLVSRNGRTMRVSRRHDLTTLSLLEETIHAI